MSEEIAAQPLDLPEEAVAPPAGARSPDDRAALVTRLFGVGRREQDYPKGASFLRAEAPERAKTEYAFASEASRLSAHTHDIDAALKSLQAKASRRSTHTAEVIAEVEQYQCLLLDELRAAAAAEATLFESHRRRLVAARHSKVRAIEILRDGHERPDRIAVAWAYTAELCWCPYCNELHGLALGLGYAPCREGLPALDAMVLVQPSDEVVAQRLAVRFTTCRGAMRSGDRCPSGVGEGERHCKRHRRERPYGDVDLPSCPKAWTRLEDLQWVDPTTPKPTDVGVCDLDVTPDDNTTNTDDGPPGPRDDAPATVQEGSES